jgi:hypothetical protein
MSVRLSVRMEQLDSLCTDFNKIWHLSVFIKYITKIQFSLRITGVLHEDQYTFFIINRSIYRRMRNVSDKCCREKQKTHLIFSRIVSLMRRYVKILYYRIGHRWHFGVCALLGVYLSLQLYTQNVLYLQLFHCKNGCTNAPQCYVIRTMPILLSATLGCICLSNG